MARAAAFVEAGLLAPAKLDRREGRDAAATLYKGADSADSMLRKLYAELDARTAREIFDMLDDDGSSSVSRLEFLKGMRALGLSDATDDDILDIFDDIDVRHGPRALQLEPWARCLPTKPSTLLVSAGGPRWHNHAERAREPKSPRPPSRRAPQWPAAAVGRPPLGTLAEAEHRRAQQGMGLPGAA